MPCRTTIKKVYDDIVMGITAMSFMIKNQYLKVTPQILLFLSGMKSKSAVLFINNS